MDKVGLYDEAFARANDLYKRDQYEDAAKEAREAVRLAEELGATGTTRTAATLLDLIENELHARAMAATADVPRLLQDLATPEWPQAIKALKGIGQAAVLPLCELLNNPIATIKQRGLAASALGEIGDPGALEVLLQFLQDPALPSDKYAMRSAIFAFEHFQDERIVQALKPLRRHSEEGIRDAAEIVLERYGVA